ncbi:MAG: MASE3 domain-containing protein [Planctomycetota bacterium]|jgi:PAS domain S-box-containing protein
MERAPGKPEDLAPDPDEGAAHPSTRFFRILFDLIFWSVLLGGLILASRYNYLLFHALGEGFAIAVALGMFMVAWNGRRFLRYDYLVFLGTAYLFVASIDFLHLLAYKGMGIFPGGGSNLPTQLWVTARSIESVSFLTASIYFHRRMNTVGVFSIYTLVTSLLLFAIFLGHFPACYIEGEGLTPFKKFAEYGVSLLFAVAGGILWFRRDRIDTGVFRLVLAALAVTVASELAFTLYVDVYGFFNLLGHFLKILSFYLIYRAVIQTSLMKPYNLLFLDLKRSEDSLREAREGLERKVADRTKDLADVNEVLRQSEERYRLLAENVADVIWTADADLILTYMSPSVERLRGYTAADTLAQGLGEILVPESVERARGLLEDEKKAVPQDRGPSSSPRTLELEVRCKDGSTIWTETTIRFLRDASGLPTGIVGVMRDITARRELEGHLLHAQKMEAMGRLAGGVAHDFKNMLHVVGGFASRLRRRIDPEAPVTTEVEGIRKAVDHASALTGQLLAFGRKQALLPLTVDLNEVVSSFEPMIGQTLMKGQELRAEYADGPCWIHADPTSVEQAIVNLAMNARDAMTEGGTLTLRTERMEPEGECAAGSSSSHVPGVRLTVSDTGYGMDPETLSAAFDPFFTTKKPGSGTGLGLSMVYGTLRQNGADIRARSEPGEGTTFEIDFPGAPPPERESPAPMPESTPAPPTPAPSATILLVEDEAWVRDLVRLELEEQDFTVLEARNGGEALEKTEAHAGPIHLLFTDVELPGLSGPELYERLRTTLPELRVLFMSGHAEERFSDRTALPADAGFLAKPFHPEEMMQKIRRTLQ